MRVIISIHLSRNLDRALRSKTTNSHNDEGHASLHRLFAKYRVKPEPLFPDASASLAAPIWQAACQDDKAVIIVSELLKIPGVEGAYINPPEGLPGAQL